MKAKVLSEKYQISYRSDAGDVIEDVKYKDAYWRAFQVAGEHRCAVSILRVTTVETPPLESIPYATFLDGYDKETTDIVTGSVTIDAEHFARDVELSRYHPVNGWVLPEYVNDFEDYLPV
jgi:hypothetical protein